MRYPRVAPILESPIAFVSYEIGPSASRAQARQRVVEFKTRLHENTAYLRAITMSDKPVALLTTDTVAVRKTRVLSPSAGTGAKGKTVSATQSMNTGAPSR